MQNKIFYLINILLFQISWFSAALIPSYAIAIMLCVIAWHYYLISSYKADLYALFYCLCFGAIVDLIAMNTGLLRLFEPIIINVFDEFSLLVPSWWLLCLWGCFSLTLNHSVSWLGHLPIYFQFLLGAILGPLSYYAAQRLGVISYDIQLWSMLVIHSVSWGVLLVMYYQKIAIYTDDKNRNDIAIKSN